MSNLSKEARERMVMRALERKQYSVVEQRKALILDLLREIATPIIPWEIADYLKSQGYRVTAATVSRVELPELMEEGKVGRYRHPENRNVFLYYSDPDLADSLIKRDE